MSNLLCCCGCSKPKRKNDDNYKVHRETVSESLTNASQLRKQQSHNDEQKYADTLLSAPVDDIDPGALKFVKKKLRNVVPPTTSYEQITSMAKKYTSAQKMGYYFAHLVTEAAGDIVLETTEEIETSFTNAWERAMAQKRTIQRMEIVTKFPVKLILRDLKHSLPPFISSFSKMIQLEFGPFHAALIIDDVVVEWDDSGLIMPDQVDHEWIFQARLQGDFNNYVKAMKPKMKESARRMDFEKQIEQVFEATREKQQAINQLIDVIVHYNTHYEYNILTRNCQHFVLDAMKALGINQVPQFTGVFQKYFEALKKGKSPNILEQFETHAELDEHVNSIMRPGLSQHDLEYLMCQYFMFHVSSCNKRVGEEEPMEWTCEVENCRMKEIELMLERDTGSLLFTSFSLNNE